MKYKAFLSYSTTRDTKIARALQQSLHNFAKPWYKIRSMRVFRDQTSLAASPELWASIEAVLNDSDYLVLLASPEAASSYWVDREVHWWLKNRSAQKMIIVLTGGELTWDRTGHDYDWQQTTSLPPCLHHHLNNEPLYVDMRWAKNEKSLSLRNQRFRRNVLDIAAPLFGRDKDELDGEDIRQQRKNIRFAWAGGLGLAVALSLALWSSHETIVQRRISSLTGQSDRARSQLPSLLPQSVLFATDAMLQGSSLQADQALYKSLSLLGPIPIVTRRYRGLKDLILSPQGTYLAVVSFDGPVDIQDTGNGKTIVSLTNQDPLSKIPISAGKVAFSDGEDQVAILSILGLSTSVWDLPSGRIRFHTPMNRGAIISIALSANGNVLATGHTDGTIFLWDIARKLELMRVSLPEAPQTIRFSPDGQFLAASSSLGLNETSPNKKNVFLWNIKNNREVGTLEHTSAVTKFLFSPNSKYLATTSRVGPEQEEKNRLGHIKVWGSTTGEVIFDSVADGHVDAMKFSSDSNFLLAGRSDGSFRLLGIKEKKDVLEVLSPANNGSVKEVALIKVNGEPYFISADDDGVVRFLSATSPVQESLRLFHLESPTLLALAFNQAKGYLVTISHDLEASLAPSPDKHDRYLHLWTVASMQKQLPLDHQNIVVESSFSPDGSSLVTMATQMPAYKIIPKTLSSNTRIVFTDQGKGSLSMWEVATRKMLFRINHPFSVISMDYDPTGRYVASGSVDGLVRIFDARKGRELAKFRHEGWVFKVKFSPDGRSVSASSGSPELMQGKQSKSLVTVWDWQTDQQLRSFVGNSLFADLAFSPDGKRIAAGGYGGELYILSSSDATQLQLFQHEEPIWSLAFSPNGIYVATASGKHELTGMREAKGKTSLWDTRKTSQVILDKSQNYFVNCVRFSPDGRLLASIDQKGNIGIWNSRSGRRLSTLIHDNATGESTLTFSPDSSYLASASGKQVQIWDIRSGREVARREHQYGTLWNVAFSPDGKLLVTTSTDMTARLWHWRPSDLTKEACGKLAKNLPGYSTVCK